MEVAALSLRTSPGGVKTADLRGQTRIPQPTSLIPLLSPKSARNQVLSSSLPTSLSVPQLGLVPPNRTPSGSGHPSHTAIPPHPPPVISTHASGGSSLPSLRTLRSLLPFGSGKPSSGTASSGPLRSPFASFGPARRSSATIERKISSQFSRPADDGDGAVISIAPSPPRQASPERTRDAPSSADAHDSSASSPLSRSPLREELGPPVVTFNPEPPLSSELSTILESDLSGLSKHLPALDESQITDLSGIRYPLNPGASPPSPGTDDDEFVVPDTSVLDLSTSQLKEEVMHALKEKPSTNGWLTGVVVEDVADSRPASRNGREAHEGYVEVEPEESLHLDALDPDLAALLSPNRVGEKQPSNLLAVPIPQKPPATAPPRIFPPSRAVTPQSRPSPLGSSPIDVSPSSATGSARSQPSPVRTTHPGLVRSVPTRFAPRLMRSATDHALTGRGVETFSRTPSDSALQFDEARRVSSDGVYLRRPPTSPLPLEFQSQSSLQQTNTEQHRRVASSRLATPARFGTHTSGAPRLLRPAFPSSSSALPTGWDGDSPSPTSRASSALGAAADRLGRPRTSEDSALGARPSARERLGYTPRSRNRSLSVGNGNGERVKSPGPRMATEWLGPRTVKAFAAAGLLDRDRDRDLGSSTSRFGSVRSLNDQRALAPSRLALSEAGSVASSWRSGSVSRAMTHSDVTASTSTGAPRTTRSAESSAPTSISMSGPQSRTPSPQNKGHQAALQAMQEKHTTETGTLLAALADAQHIAQSLRTENARLTKRVEDLETQLVAVHNVQLRAQQQQQPPLARSVFTRVERQSSADALLARRWPPPSVPIPGHLASIDADAEDATYHGRVVARSRRASGSGSESVFALPPPNMSMLLQEQPAGSRRSVSSVSVTTAGAPTDGPGSPRSLFLRPEHEMHLGDMGSLLTEDETDDAADDEDMS